MAKTKYNETFPVLAERYAREGLIDREIAKRLGVCKETYYLYQKKYPVFLDSIKKGKAPVDDDVEKALLKRALGFDYEEIMAEYSGAVKDEKKAKPNVVRRTKKLVIPDVTAQIFWLKNRRPAKWRDRHDVEFPAGLTIRVISAVPRPEKADQEAKEKNG